MSEGSFHSPLEESARAPWDPTRKVALITGTPHNAAMFILWPYVSLMNSRYHRTRWKLLD
jgi:hypothetical protein